VVAVVENKMVLELTVVQVGVLEEIETQHLVHLQLNQLNQETLAHTDLETQVVLLRIHLTQLVVVAVALVLLEETQLHQVHQVMETVDLLETVV
jgi:hypothetical protein